MLVSVTLPSTETSHPVDSRDTGARGRGDSRERFAGGKAALAKAATVPEVNDLRLIFILSPTINPHGTVIVRCAQDDGSTRDDGDGSLCPC